MERRTIWAIVTLVGGYVLAQAVADVGATRLVQIGRFVLPGGTFIFAATFTLRDLLHKRLGKEWARAAIVMAAVFNIIQSLYLAAIARLPYPPFYAVGDAWGQAFALVPAITVASILAELVSELVDTEVYHAFVQRVGPRLQWARVLVSNAVSLPLDSLLFVTLAFVLLPHIFGGDTLPFLAALRLGAGQMVYKAVVTLLSLPTIYLVQEKPLLTQPGKA